MNPNKRGTMTNTEIIKDKKRRIYNFLHNTILKEVCGGDYQKCVELIEKYEKQGKIPTYFIPRNNVITIWNDTEENVIKRIQEIDQQRQQNRQNPNQTGNG